MGYHPNAELVSIYWLKSVSGLPSDKIATTLPSDNSAIAGSGFITVQAVGGVPDPDTYMQSSLIQVDCWGYNENSEKVPWGKTYNLAMVIKEGIKSAPRTVTTPSAFDNAYVHEVIVERDPMRILDDPAFARYQMDLTIFWRQATTEGVGI